MLMTQTPGSSTGSDARPVWPSARAGFAVAVYLVAFGAVATPQAAAQRAGRVDQARGALDSRWLPWLGCWELLVQDVGELGSSRPGQPGHLAPPAGGVAGRADPRVTPTAGRPVVCLTPATDRPGTEMRTVAGDVLLLQRTVVADGLRHAVDESSCAGWELSEWSLDGRRLFTRSELACEEIPTRSVSGLSLMTPQSTWVDVRVSDSGGSKELVVRRYRPASRRRTVAAGGHWPGPDTEAAVASARRGIAVPLTVPEVIEAAERVAPEAVEAALLEAEASFALDSAALITLDEAGVPDSLVDLMVALSFPEAFIVERPAAGQSWPLAAGGGFMRWYDDLSYPYLYLSPFAVAPFGYSYWWSPRQTLQIIQPVAPSDEIGGRVVKGRGYTRVRPSQGSSGGQGAPRTGASSWGDADGGSSRGSPGAGRSGGRVTSEGYTSGGSSGRRAKPRKE